MKTAIIYHSVFHATEQYAKWLAEALAAELLPMKKAKDLSPFNRLIIMSGTYAGGMPLVGFLKKNWSKMQHKKVIVIAVGAAPEDDPMSKASYDKIPDEIKAKITYFKIRGATPFANKEKREQEITKDNLDKVLGYLQGKA